MLAMLVALFVVAHAFGWLARRLRLPPIIGHLAGGIVLGPLILGRALGHAWEDLFPTELRNDVQSISCCFGNHFCFLRC